MNQPEHEDLTIGAGPDCDIVIDADMISGRHARLSRVGRAYVLEDTGSRNGTKVDGEPIQTCSVTYESRIAFGSYETNLEALLQLAARRPRPAPPDATPSPAHVTPALPPTESDWANAEVHEVGGTMLVIGRYPECNITIPESSVTGRHAQVFRNCGRLVIEDIGSMNGTFLNGERITFGVLHDNAVVQIGSRKLRFVRAAPVAKTVDGARVDLSEVAIDVVDQTTKQPIRVVEGISFTARPGEIVGVMGPSGSGKTTVVLALAGIMQPKQGRVLFDGAPLHGPSGTIRPEIGPFVGFAPQDDIVHELLTVEEAVRYSARLRCPANLSSSELDRRVAKAIEDVGLSHKKTTRIGSSTTKSLSGGQRKRVSIAMELVTEPALLLLDEPTSGLSSRDAAELMMLLRRMADEGRTVILTIHQPSYPMFVQMDQIVLLEAIEGRPGRLAYFGPAAVEIFKFFKVTERQAGAVFDRLAEAAAEKPTIEPWADTFAKHELRGRTVDTRAQELGQFRAPSRPPFRSKGPIATLGILVQRGLLMKSRDKYFWIVALLVPLVASSIITLVIRTQLDSGEGWTTHQANVEHTYLVVLTIMVCFFGSLSTSLEILYERAVFGRERRAGLSVFPYVSSKAVMYAIPAILHPAVSLAVFLFLGGALEGSFGSYYVILVPAFFAAASAGLCLSALMSSAEGVLGFAVFYSIVQTVFTAFAPLHVTQGDTGSQKWLEWVATPITGRWTIGGLTAQSDICVEGNRASESEEAEPPPSAGGTPAPSGSAGVPDAPGAPPVKPAVSPEAMAFPKQCVRQYYNDHGVHPADESEERLNSKYATASIGANGILAFAALIGAGLLLRRRKR